MGSAFSGEWCKEAFETCDRLCPNCVLDDGSEIDVPTGLRVSTDVAFTPAVLTPPPPAVSESAAMA